MQICDRTFNLTGKTVKSKYMVRILGPDADTAYSLCEDEMQNLLKWFEERPELSPPSPLTATETEAAQKPATKKRGRGRPRKNTGLA